MSVPYEQYEDEIEVRDEDGGSSQSEEDEVQPSTSSYVQPNSPTRTRSAQLENNRSSFSLFRPSLSLSLTPISGRTLKKRNGLSESRRHRYC